MTEKEIVAEVQGTEPTQTDVNKLVTEQLGFDLETAKQKIELANKYQEVETEYNTLKTKSGEYEQKLSRYEGNEFVKTLIDVTENNPEKIDAFLTLSKSKLETLSPLDTKVLKLQLEKGWDKDRATEYVKDNFDVDNFDEDIKAKAEKKLKWEAEDDAKWLSNYKKEITTFKKAEPIVEEKLDANEITTWIGGSKEKFTFEPLGKVNLDVEGFKYEYEVKPDEEVINKIVAGLPQHAVNNKIKKDEKNLEVLKQHANLAYKLSINPIKLVENILEDALKKQREYLLKEFSSPTIRTPKATVKTKVETNSNQPSFFKPVKKKN